MAKIKMKSLVVDRRVWVRKKLTIDHIECMVRDIMNGAKLPPLKVDKNSRIIVDGNHQYEALKKIHGEKWPDQTVEVEWLDLPEFEEDPAAWWKEALEDNQHNAQRLYWQDRQRVAANLAKTLRDPFSEESKELAKLIKHTPETWRAFYNNYLGGIAGDCSPVKPNGSEEKDSSAKEDKKKIDFEPTGLTPERPNSKRPDTPTWPGDLRPKSVNSSILHHAASLKRILSDVEPDDLSKQSREALKELTEQVLEMTADRVG